MSAQLLPGTKPEMLTGNFGASLNWHDPACLAYRTIGGEMVYPPSCELDRIWDENQAALKPFQSFPRAYTLVRTAYLPAKGKPYTAARDSIPGGNFRCDDAAEMKRREISLNRIMRGIPQ